MRARARRDRRETLVAWRGMMATRRGRCDVRGAVEGWWMDDSLCVCAMCASGGVGGRRARAGRRPTIDRCMVCVTLETDLGRRRLARDARRFFRKTLISSTRRLLWKLASTSSSVSYSRRTRASWMSSARCVRVLSLVSTSRAGVVDVRREGASLLWSGVSMRLCTCACYENVRTDGVAFLTIRQGCFSITTIFSHSQTVVLCGSCSAVLCQPTGGKARLTEGCEFRQKGN